MSNHIRNRVSESNKCTVSEKTMLFRTVFTITVAILCFLAMGLTAFARFTADIVISSNTISTAKYTLNIKVTCDGADVTVTSGKFSAASGKEYEITMEYISGSARTGYCAVTVGSTKYATAQIGADSTVTGGRRDSITFKIVGGSTTKTVTMTPNWGTSTHHAEFVETGVDGVYYITPNETISA